MELIGGRQLRGDEVPGVAGVVDEDVEGRGVLADDREGRGHRGVRVHVERDEDRVRAVGLQLRDGFAPALLVARSEEDLPAHRPEAAGGLETEALVGAGDEDRGL
ncbi:hypothetical protein QWI33_15085 [Glycomyces tritici]|uniref:Uncharacterized protein n=1 Tax=Glycomyces tritici TaxID=2665176 RepID=A0ABT7YR09_9ACTN|nr:hypothetical protein [Glycomyces tritici]MDN3241055.1 hypothetical protein [Glycomyces tritici]